MLFGKSATAKRIVFFAPCALFFCTKQDSCPHYAYLWLRRSPQVDVIFSQTASIVSKHGQDATCHRERRQTERNERQVASCIYLTMRGTFFSIDRGFFLEVIRSTCNWSPTHDNSRIMKRYSRNKRKVISPLHPSLSALSHQRLISPGEDISPHPYP